MRPEVISAVLVALGAIGTWLSVILTRRGKREDTRLQQVDQAFDHMKELADTRAADILRVVSERDAAVADAERIRLAWEARWDRQIVRCRTITANLVDAIAELRKAAGPAVGDVKVNEAMQELQEHNEDDHPTK